MNSAIPIIGGLVVLLWVVIAPVYCIVKLAEFKKRSKLGWGVFAIAAIAPSFVLVSLLPSLATADERKSYEGKFTREHNRGRVHSCRDNLDGSDDHLLLQIRLQSNSPCSARRMASYSFCLFVHGMFSRPCGFYILFREAYQKCRLSRSELGTPERHCDASVCKHYCRSSMGALRLWKFLVVGSKRNLVSYPAVNKHHSLYLCCTPCSQCNISGCHIYALLSSLCLWCFWRDLLFRRFMARILAQQITIGCTGSWQEAAIPGKTSESALDR